MPHEGVKVPTCTYCGSTAFRIGPSGGPSTNICCANPDCRHWFNWTATLHQLDDLDRVNPMPKIFTIASVPAHLQPAWLQHLRDFDCANPGCHFEVAMDAPEMTLAEAIELLKVNPALTFTQIFARTNGRDAKDE